MVHSILGILNPLLDLPQQTEIAHFKDFLSMLANGKS